MVDAYQKGEPMAKTKYEYENDFENFMDDALNDLSPDSFKGLLDFVFVVLNNYKKDAEVKINE